MAGRSNLKRKSYFVDEKTVSRARKALGAATDSEAIRLSVAHVAEMEEFWSFMKRSRGTLGTDSIRTP